MNIIPDSNRIDRLNKPEQELVEQEKQEYFLIGEFIRTPGLKLFGYNYLENKVFEVQIKHGNTINLVPMDGKLIPVDYEAEKCTVNSRFDYFEALKIETALKRVEKYKQGKLKYLSNLRKYNPDSIKIFN